MAIADVHGRLSDRHPERRLIPTKPIAGLPDALFSDQYEWETLAHGRWLWSDHISLGEGRAVLRLLDAILHIPKWHRRRILSLEDNRAIVGIFNRGRSCSLGLNYLARRKAARTFAARLRLLLPWIDTHRMPAGDASRLV